MYEQVLSQLCVPIAFTKDSAFVPSFFEDWVFYQVSLKWWIKPIVLRFQVRYFYNPFSLLWPKFDPSRKSSVNKSVPGRDDPDAGHEIPINTTTLASVHTKGGGYLYLFVCLVINKLYNGAQLFFLLTVNNQTKLPNSLLQTNSKAIQTHYCTNNFNKTEMKLHEILMTHI